MAYQVACIRNMNTLAFAVGSFLISLGLFVTESLDTFLRILIVEKKSSQSVASQAFTRLASPLMGFLLRLSIRPSFYKDADSLATQFLSDPKTVSQVLWKLDSYSKTQPLQVPLSTAHIFMVSPLTQVRWSRWYAAQPPTPDRIKRLVGYYPI